MTRRVRTRHRRLGITLIVMCQSTQALVYGGVALFLPLIRTDLHLSFRQAGALAAAGSLVYALTQLPAGYLADRFAPGRLFLIGLLGTNVLAFGFALLRSYHLLLLNQALSGFFRALVFAPGLLLISREFPAERRATAMGLYVAGGFSSSIVLNILGPVLVGPLGWARLFVVFAATGLLVLGLYAWLGAGHAPRPGGGGVRMAALPALLRHRALWTIGFIQFVRLAVAQGFAFWLPTYLVVDRGHSLATAGLLAGLGAMATAPANVVGGLLADRSGRPRLVIGASLAALTVSLCLLTLAHGLVLTTVSVMVTGLFVQLYFGPLFALPIQLLGARTAGVVSGFGNFCANVGAFVCVYALGALRDGNGSFRIGFLALAALCAAAGLATWSLGRASGRRVATADVRHRAGRRVPHVDGEL